MGSCGYDNKSDYCQYNGRINIYTAENDLLTDEIPALGVKFVFKHQYLQCLVSN